MFTREERRHRLPETQRLAVTDAQDWRMTMLDYWPLFGLEITTPRLRLWTPTDADLLEVIDVVKAGVHDPSSTPFVTPWTDPPSPELERGILQYWWRCRGGFTPDLWDLGLVASAGDQILGAQALLAKDFPLLRTAETGSWLGSEHQGKGYGKEMRRAMLHLAFEQLGADQVTSEAFVDNPASQAVSRAVGYEDNGFGVTKRRDGRDHLVRFRITRERWLETRTDMPVEVRGFEACRPLFGLD